MSKLVKPCAVAECYNSAKDGVSFHSFPKDERLKSLWIHFVQLKRLGWHPSEKSVICSAHFLEECFETTNVLKNRFQLSKRRLKLRPGSVPSIFLAKDELPTVLDLAMDLNSQYQSNPEVMSFREEFLTPPKKRRYAFDTEIIKELQNAETEVQRKEEEMHGINDAELAMVRTLTEDSGVRSNKDYHDLFTFLNRTDMARGSRLHRTTPKSARDDDKKTKGNGGKKTKDGGGKKTEGTVVKKTEGTVVKKTKGTVVKKPKDNDGMKTKDNDGKKMKVNDGKKTKGTGDKKTIGNDGKKTKDNDGKKTIGNDGKKPKGEGGKKTKDTDKKTLGKSKSIKGSKSHSRRKKKPKVLLKSPMKNSSSPAKSLNEEDKTALAYNVREVPVQQMFMSSIGTEYDHESRYELWPARDMIPSLLERDRDPIDTPNNLQTIDEDLFASLSRQRQTDQNAQDVKCMAGGYNEDTVFHALTADSSHDNKQTNNIQPYVITQCQHNTLYTDIQAPVVCTDTMITHVDELVDSTHTHDNVDSTHTCDNVDSRVHVTDSSKRLVVNVDVDSLDEEDDKELVVNVDLSQIEHNVDRTQIDEDVDRTQIDEDVDRAQIDEDVDRAQIDEDVDRTQIDEDVYRIEIDEDVDIATITTDEENYFDIDSLIEVKGDNTETVVSVDVSEMCNLQRFVLDDNIQESEHTDSTINIQADTSDTNTATIDRQEDNHCFETIPVSFDIDYDESRCSQQ